MTKLKKPVRRTCTHSIFGGRPLVIIVMPTDTEDVILIRQAGRRRAYGLPVLTVYYAAARQYAEEVRRAKFAARKARKAGRA